MNEFKAENIPNELKILQQWTPTKGKRAFLSGWNAPEKALTFEEAVRQSDPFPGFIIREGLFDTVFCLDFDKVLQGEKRTPSKGFLSIVGAIKEKAGLTYTEKSQSGLGYHAFYRASIPPGYPDTLKIHLDGGGCLEVYTGTGKGRYICLTGKKQGKAATVADGTALLDYFLELAQKDTSDHNGGGGADAGQCILSVDEIPGKIRESASGELFHELFDNGNTDRYAGDDSAADMALMNLLPFWCGGDAAIMEQVFSMSALAKRDKWQRQDYRERTIKAALKSWDGQYYTGHSRSEDDFEDLDKDIIKAPKWPVIDELGKVPQPIKQAWENTAYLLNSLGIECRYNILTKEIDFAGHNLNGLSLDAAATHIRGLMYRNGLKISRADMFDNIGIIAEMNRYSPVREYLTQCQVMWDGKDYITQLFDCLTITDSMKEYTELYMTLFRRWLIGAARIAFNEGTDSMQGILVLQGPQGIGKTRFLYVLLPYQSWGADGISLDPSQKDDVLKVSRYWLVELGELGETIRKERLDRLKQFITQGTDSLRKPYKRTSEQMPRTTAFIGTVNGSEFLKDNTGERRYWVIPVLSIHIPANFDTGHLWGQVMHLAYEKKERHWLNNEEIAQLNKGNEPFKKVSDEEQLLLDCLDWNAAPDKWTRRTPTEVSHEIGYGGKKPRQVGRAISSIMRKDDRVKAPTNLHGGRVYLLPPLSDDVDSIF